MPVERNMPENAADRHARQVRESELQLRAIEGARWHVEQARDLFASAGHSYAVDESTKHAITVALKCLTADRAYAERMADAAGRMSDDFHAEQDAARAAREAQQAGRRPGPSILDIPTKTKTTTR